LKGKPHRIGGPAINYKGNQKWYLNGKQHREDGPAVINLDGTEEWYINGKRLSEQEINAIKLNKELEKELYAKDTIKKKTKI
jgi:hypothetical protein